MPALPGLFLALLAALLAGALRRWWDPVPARVWAVFGLLLLILFGPALFLGRVLLPADILPGLAADSPPEGNPLQLDLVTQVAPTLAQVRRAVKAGEWPFWNPLVGAGMPLLADPQAQVLQPLVLAALPLPLEQAVGVTAGLRVLLPLVFSFLLLRRQGISEGAALFGSVAFGLSGFVLLWLGWPIASSASLLPLVLYAIVMTDARGARRDFLLLILGAFAVLTGGHPETILYVVLVSVLFALARRRPALLGRWALAGMMAFGLAAPALLPASFYLPQTHRHAMVEERNLRMSSGVSGAPEGGGSMEERLVPVFAPRAFGDSRSYRGAGNVNEDASGFVGSAALLAALTAFLPGRRFPQERLFLGLAVVSLIVALRPPGLARAFAAIPGLDRSPTSHHRVLLILAFSLAYLAACSVERWRSGERRKVGLGVCGAVMVGLFFWGYSSGWTALQVAAVVGAAAVMMVGARSAPYGLAAILAVELISFHRSANPAVPRAAYYPTTPAVAFLQKNLGGDRIAGAGDRLRPNVASVYGLADIRASNPMKPFLYSRMVAPVSRSVRDIEDVFLKTEHPVYERLGVRYVVAPPAMKRARGQRPVFRDATAVIFERSRVLPRLFLSPGESGSLEILSLEPARIAARARLDGERLAGSSVYQDGGWRLLVDGRPGETRLDGGPFVAARLPAGEHRLDLVHRPPGFLLGMLLAALALAGAAVWLVPARP
jgi:hypothetical protein